MSHHDVMQDKDYNLVSALYHALQGVETTRTYMADADKAGDADSLKFLQDAQEKYRGIAENAKQLLGKRLGS